MNQVNKERAVVGPRRVDLKALGPKPIAPIPLKPVDSLTITYLIDNVADGLTPDKGPARRPRMQWSRQSTPLTTPTNVVDYLVAEVGFAAMVTAKRNSSVCHLLFDAGRSPNGLVENMERLGFDPKQIEAVVLSHGHWDHVTGLDGLSRALGGSEKLLLILHPDAFTKRRISVRGIAPLELPTLSRPALREAGFELIEERAPSTLFDSSVLITGEIDRTCPFEKGMSSLHEAWRDDCWEHDPLVLDEQGLVIYVCGLGLVVITGCGHCGVVNLVRYATRLTDVRQVHAIVGGYHLSGREPWMNELIQELAAFKPSFLAPAHCVSHLAMSRLEAAFPEQLIPNCVGTTYHFAPSS